MWFTILLVFISGVLSSHALFGKKFLNFIIQTNCFIIVVKFWSNYSIFFCTFTKYITDGSLVHAVLKGNNFSIISISEKQKFG